MEKKKKRYSMSKIKRKKTSMLYTAFPASPVFASVLHEKKKSLVT